MTLSGQKTIAWWQMSLGFVLLLFFICSAAYRQTLPALADWSIYLWPLAGLIHGLWGLFALRSLYRQEPPVPPAGFQLSLTDLLAGAAFSALASGLFSKLLGNTNPLLLPAVGMVALALYAHGALAASLKGILYAWHRHLFVLSHVFLTVGGFGIFLFVSALISAPLVEKTYDWIAFATIFAPQVFSGADPFPVMLRIFILALIPGLVLRMLWRRLSRRPSQPPPAGSES